MRKISIKETEKKKMLKEFMEIYPGLLTEKEKKVLKLYIKPNLSGSDVARRLKITRQAVHDHVKRALYKMESCEAQVHLLKRKKTVRKDFEKLVNLIEQISVRCNAKEIEEIKKLLAQLEKNL